MATILRNIDGTVKQNVLIFDTNLSATVCPKVLYKSKVPLFSAIYGQILKPFGLLIVQTGRFDFEYKVP